MATRNSRDTVLLSALAGLSLLLPSVGCAEIIKFEDMRRGTSVTASQCGMHSNAVWVSAYGRGICMRYYLSEAGGGGKQATIFLNGDRGGTIPGERVKPEHTKDTDTDAMKRRAQTISIAMGQPAIYMARMGLDGSSGHHAQRRTKLELAITNAAIEAIKQRHSYTSFNMYGQSGGASLIGGLLPMRNDINCAVPGSGRLIARAEAIRRNSVRYDPALHVINPYDGIGKIVRTSRAKIMVVTDPLDQIVTREHQDPFVQALRRAGRQVDQFYVSASDATHHSVARFALTVTRECARGGTRDQIVHALAEDAAAKIRVVKPVPRRPPASNEEPSRVTPPPKVPGLTVPQRIAQPQAPARPAYGSPERASEPRKQCLRYFAEIGRNVDVPCE